jgi:ABC-type nickel/cobalt efflux system permease component RcnA
MILLIGSAALVGFVHSLAPGHWLPIVLMAKSRRWHLQLALLGALTVAAGHVFISSAIGVASVALEGHFLKDVSEATVERYAALLLVIFGLAFAGFSLFRHSSCHGHEHHGPHPRRGRAPFLFLFSIGFSPCVAVLPIFLAAAARGWAAAIAAMVSFSVGVALSLLGSTAAVTLGLLKLDHPIFEHYGDVLTGAAVAAMGVFLFFIPI